MRLIFGLIWRCSEFFGIPLGRFAPWVFGASIGRMPRRKPDEERNPDGQP